MPLYRSFATRVSQLKIWYFWVIGVERNVCRLLTGIVSGKIPNFELWHCCRRALQLDFKNWTSWTFNSQMEKHCSINLNVLFVLWGKYYPQCRDVFKIVLIKVGLYSPFLSEKLIQVWKFVRKFILINMPTFDGKFFFLTPLWLLQDQWIVYRCFQAVVIFFLLKVAKLSKGPSDKFVSS